MFGSEFSRHPEILFDSFIGMGQDYKKKVNKQRKRNLLIALQKTYIRVFGIPEIGFQIRSQYFKNIIRRVIDNKKIEKVLDAGSGIGIYSLWLSGKFKDSIVEGWEIDKTKLEFSKKFAKELNIKNVNFMYGDITKTLITSSKYDLIINIDVLEHIASYKKVLKNFYKLLSEGGYLYIHTPQINQKRIFKALEKWHHEDHLREGFPPKTLKDDLVDIGFKIIDLRETFGFFGKFAWELNHLSFQKGFFVAGIIYPFLYFLACLDLFTNNKESLGTAILAQKI